MPKNLNDIKKEYGEIVTNTAIFNLLSFGIDSYENVTWSELLKSIDYVFDELEEKKRRLPVTKNFLKQVANCQMNLKDINRLELMTYFSKPTNKEDDG